MAALVGHLTISTVMARLLPHLLAWTAIVLAQVCRGDVPAQNNNLTGSMFPVGKWKVAFQNGVTEVCDIFNFDGGHATVDEPRRRSGGAVVVHGDSAVITFDDDRVERWTSEGKHFVVEHWFPGSGFPAAAPVLGIAERTP